MSELIRLPLPRRNHWIVPGDHAIKGALQLAQENGIPVCRAGRLDHVSTIDALASARAELLVCACFNRLIPEPLYNSFIYGGVNCHPSLLPELRGPDPAFWTFKLGLRRSGLTLHRLTNRYDSGNVLRQRRFDLFDGLTENEFDVLTGRISGELLLQTLSDLSAGTQQEYPQDELKRTYAPHPDQDDFQLDRTGSARDAFNFVRGIGQRGVPILVQYHGRQHVVSAAKGYTDGKSDEILPEPAEGNATIDFESGRLIADLA